MNRKRICIVVLVSVSMCMAQSLRELRGEIHAEATADLSWLTVRLDAAGGQGRETAHVGFGGDFEFRNLPEGRYILRLIAPSGNEVLSQPVTVGGTNPPISLELPKSAAGRPSGETVSVAQLRHRPNKQALQDARKAQKLAESGAYERAVEEWKKALEADPEFSEAYSNLGAQYARLSRFSEAVGEFQRAIALDPGTARHQSNLAIALAQLGRLDEAESWARHAVQQDGSNALGHFVLGCVLTSRPAKAAEAIQQLQIAARQIPRVHEILANIYRAQGKEELAMAETKRFQEASQAQDGHQPESWGSLLH